MGGSYALSGICNPLGTIGLGTSGTYSSYDPYTSGLYGGYNLYGGYGNYANSLFNMYQNMQTAQQNMEISNANHINTMNGIMNNNEVSAVGNAQSNLISKILQNSSVMALVDNLIDKVSKGELDGVCNQYDALKNQIYATYRDEISERGNKENPEVAVRKIIDNLYTKEMELSGVQNACLRDDIAKYGDSAFKNGILQETKAGHDKKYVEETLYHIYNEDISNQEYNESARGVGMMLGGAFNGAKQAIKVGAVVGGVTTAVAGSAKLIDSMFKISTGLLKRKEGFAFGKWAGYGLKGAAVVATAVFLYDLGKGIFNGFKSKANSLA